MISDIEEPETIVEEFIFNEGRDKKTRTEALKRFLEIEDRPTLFLLDVINPYPYYSYTHEDETENRLSLRYNISEVLENEYGYDVDIPYDNKTIVLESLKTIVQMNEAPKEILEKWVIPSMVYFIKSKNRKYSHNVMEIEGYGYYGGVKEFSKSSLEALEVLKKIAEYYPETKKQILQRLKEKIKDLTLCWIIAIEILSYLFENDVIPEKIHFSNPHKELAKFLEEKAKLDDPRITNLLLNCYSSYTRQPILPEFIIYREDEDVNILKRLTKLAKSPRSIPPKGHVVRGIAKRIQKFGWPDSSSEKEEIKEVFINSFNNMGFNELDELLSSESITDKKIAKEVLIEIFKKESASRGLRSKLCILQNTIERLNKDPEVINVIRPVLIQVLKAKLIKDTS
ncbi:MAG: hypothetical protein ABEJ02_01600 [Candidatus Paceibacteria bacterium]